jgi:hypothetical protein
MQPEGAIVFGQTASGQIGFQKIVHGQTVSFPGQKLLSLLSVSASSLLFPDEFGDKLAQSGL